MRTLIAPVVVCACASASFGGALIVEPDQFIQTLTRLHMYGGEIQEQFTGTSGPTFGRRISEGTSIRGVQGPTPSSRNWNRIEYLLAGDPPGEPLVATDRIFIGGLALTRSGNSSAGIDRLASIQFVTQTQFSLTEPAVADLSGFINTALSDLDSGGNRFAHMNVSIRRVDTDLPEQIFWLDESNEEIPSSIDWSEVLEPGHYSFSVGLQSLSSASAPGDMAVSNLSTNLELNFSAIPSPGSIGLIGLAGAFASRRRR